MADSNSRIKIAELLDINEINDDNLIIVEDSEDTKKAKIRDLKNTLSGDFYSPSLYRFYSSAKIEELINALNILIASKASSGDIEKLSNSLNQIIKNNPDGTKDQELIAARGDQSTLGERFDYERYLSNGCYMKKSIKTVVGNIIDEYNEGPIELSVIPDGIETSSKGIITFTSKNIFNKDKSTAVTGFNHIAVSQNNGFKVTEKLDSSTKSAYVKIEVDKTTPAGTYYMITNITFSADFTNKECTFDILYADGTIESIPYYHQELFEFTANKSFTAVRIKYDIDSIVQDSYVIYDNFMISSYVLNSYTAYETKEITNVGQYYSKIIDNHNYTITHTIPNSKLQIKFYDQSITTDTILEKINTIKTKMDNNIDKCGLMKNYGIYQFFNHYDVNSSDQVDIEDSSEEFYRNGVPSKKITIHDNATSNIKIKQIIDTDISLMESVSLYFYIDRTVFSNFTDSTGIKIHLCSDIPSVNITNYYTYTIKKYEMVQGWNSIKRQLSEFDTTGNPDSHSIKTITVEIDRNDNLNGKSFYLNSAAFNQKMKPTILLCFDGTYDTSVSYLYPYLSARDIPATLLLNSSRTLTAATIDSIIKLRVSDHWDIGMYGCNPHKEYLIDDDNYRNQYVSLKTSKEWLQDIIYSPVSYCAPYGNLRPITVPLLKDLGFRIARTEGTGYISNFTKYDFAIPSQLMNNTNTFDEIKERIDYAIENDVSLCLYTNDVTEYGTEMSAKQVLFESVINYIIENRDKGLLQCLSLRDFYTKCVE